MKFSGMIFLLLLAIIFSVNSWGGEEIQKETLTVWDLLKIEPPPADFIIPYGQGPYQFGQLRLPDGEGPHPVVVVIHGGCWLAQYDLQHISPLAAEITKLGYATWSLEYRRLGNPGGGWPGTFEDIADGIDHLQVVAPEHKLDLGRVITLGHSAGGHLALWAAARRVLSPESRFFRGESVPVQGVVSLAGAGDLSRPEFQGVCNQAVQRLMGGTPLEFPERYRQGSPMALLPLGVPQILIQGGKDPIISPASGRDYQAAAQAQGDTCTLVELPEAGHYELVIPSTFAWHEVRAAVHSLLDK